MALVMFGLMLGASTAHAQVVLTYPSGSGDLNLVGTFSDTTVLTIEGTTNDNGTATTLLTSDTVTWPAMDGSCVTAPPANQGKCELTELLGVSRYVIQLLATATYPSTYSSAVLNVRKTAGTTFPVLLFHAGGDTAAFQASSHGTEVLDTDLPINSFDAVSPTITFESAVEVRATDPATDYTGALTFTVVPQ
ncbi:MAG: hypothetical protein JRI25_09930 [Deltaproteobacteria bacterium]|nr:hypothetical protein [Deltaproteobacteria bacterium]